MDLFRYKVRFGTQGQTLISLLLFFSYFSTRARLIVRKILQFGYAIDRPAKSVKSCYRYYPLLYYNYRPLPGIRGRGIELLLSSNIAPRFKDIEYKETCLPGLSGQKWEVHKMPKHLNKRGRVYRYYLILYLQPRLVVPVFYFAFYRCHV
jgi:hypothetical protein